MLCQSVAFVSELELETNPRTHDEFTSKVYGRAPQSRA